MRRGSGRTLALAGILAALVGLAGGLALSWGVWPTEYYDAEPADLRAELRGDELLLISQSYSVHEDLDQARRRLLWLGLREDQAAQALTELVDSQARSEADVIVSRGLSKLAYALGARDKQVLVFIVTPTPTIRPTPSSTPTTPAAMPTAGPIISTPILTPAPRPSAEAAATRPTARFVMEDKQFECRPVPRVSGSAGLLAVRVRDEQGRALPGIPLLISWGADEDQFFTGLKRRNGLDYADFEMQPEQEYALHVNNRAGQPVRVSFRDEDCSTGALTGTLPVWELTFRREQALGSSVTP